MKKFRQKIQTVIISGVMAGLFVAVAPGMVSAQSPTTSTASDPCAAGSIVAFPRWYDGICKVSNGTATVKSPNEVGGIPKFLTIIAMNIVTIMLMIVGYVSLAFVIWGGFKYMYSGYNASGIASARKTILNAVIGLVLSIMSVAIVKVIAGAIA